MRKLLLLFLTPLFTLAQTTVKSGLGPSVQSMLQDKSGNYWFGTNGTGVYRLSGKKLVQFTTKDGLANDQVLSIQEDKTGNIWFGTGKFGVSRFDGKTFTSFSDKDSSEKLWKKEADDLWFSAGGGTYRYGKNTFTYLPFPKDSGFPLSPADKPGPYGVYSILKDSKGNIWFGTQSNGVCMYDGSTFTWLTEKGLKGPAVLALFEDKTGSLWFGNNGQGLFRYDGNILWNITEEQGLSNLEFIKRGLDGPGTMGRVTAINQDKDGNMWIGTVDAGLWKYDGRKMMNYTTVDGLTSDHITCIYKDNKGELWFGTNGTGVCKYNGTHFESFTFK